MNFFLNHWKEFSALGAIALPLIGIFMSTAKAIEWTKPFGHYTQSRLFIKNNGSSGTTSSNHQVADLLAEFPLKYLDKESWWKYCLPKSSKLKSLETTITSANEEDCKLDWWNSNSHNYKNPENISYLLRLMLKFLKLQNQLNLIFLFYSDKNDRNSQLTQTSSGGTDWDWVSKIREKCQIPAKDKKDSFLKNMLTSLVPISKNCLMTPTQVDITLSLEQQALQATNSQSSSNEDTYSLDSLKKGTITGEIQYSLTDYWGNLHNFQFSDGKQSSASFSVFPSGTYTFKLNGENNGNLDFDKLFEKYQRRELDLNDFNLKTKK